MGSSLRKLLESGKCLVVPDAHDIMTARIIEAAGFEALYVGSIGSSASRWGVPDQSLISLTQLVDHFRVVSDAVSIPMVVDLEDGGPNPVSVYHNVRAAERAGAAAIQIEDQLPGKGLGPSGDLYPIEVATQKIRAAVEARRDEATIIIGRSEALNVGRSQSEAIDRCAAYVEAGAELASVSTMNPIDDLTSLSRDVGAPLTTWGLCAPTPEALDQVGHAMCLYAGYTTLVSFRAVSEALGELRDGAFRGLDGFPDLMELLGGPANQDIAKRFTE